MTMFDFHKVKKAFRKIRTHKDQGAALIVALLVMMVLVLLGLTLILQSQTEYLGAVNENDALAALSFAESGLEWAERKIKEEASGSPDLDPVLRGPDNATGTIATQVDDNLFGIRTINTTLSLSDLNLTNEQTVSVLLPYDWDNDNIVIENWEVFRTGTDLNGDNVWDGPRAIVWMRIEDNYDGPTAGVQDLDDDDWRARIRVRVQYPIFVDDTGVAQDPVLATRGIAERRIEGRLSPVQGVAIRTNKQFDGRGTYKVCGACGGIHSNGDMDSTGSSAQVCADFTATGDYDTNGQGPTVGGTSGGNQPEQFIPTINPYDPKFVPSVNTFDHAADPELNLLEPVGNILQCAPATQEDPGSSKYFALVFKTTNGELQVWKAYWDFAGGSGASRWLWRLIDVGPTLTAVLDNCGRLVSNDLGLATDPCPDGRPGCDGSDFATQGVTDIVDCCGAPWPVADGGDGSTYCDPNCMSPGLDGILGTDDDVNRCRPDSGISACDGTTSGDDQFYGFKGGGNFSTDACPGDDSLAGLNENDYARDNFFTYPSGQNSDGAVPALPETWLKDGLGGDDLPDFKFGTVTQPNRQKWDNDTSTIFSTLYNAVIFGYGNLNFNGDMVDGKIQFHDPNPTSPSLPGTYIAPVPNGRWRVSLISYGRIQVRGAPRFAPANGGTGVCATLDETPEACYVGFVAGRDLDLAGGAGTGCDQNPEGAECHLCPDVSANAGADCADASDVVPFGYEGMFLAHEQVNLSGNSNFAGFLIAEEAANCVETQTQAMQTRMNGNPDIYYDCEHPPDPWLSDLLRITSWEEVQ